MPSGHHQHGRVQPSDEGVRARGLERDGVQLRRIREHPDVHFADAGAIGAPLDTRGEPFDRPRLKDVERLALRLSLVRIHQDDATAPLPSRETAGERRAQLPGSEDGDGLQADAILRDVQPAGRFVQGVGRIQQAHQELIRETLEPANLGASRTVSHVRTRRAALESSDAVRRRGKEWWRPT